MLHAPTDTERLTAAVQNMNYLTIGVGKPKEWLTVEGLTLFEPHAVEQIGQKRHFRCLFSRNGGQTIEWRSVLCIAVVSLPTWAGPAVLATDYFNGRSDAPICKYLA
jgi:hypothetical protein